MRKLRRNKVRKAYGNKAMRKAWNELQLGKYGHRKLFSMNITCSK